MHAPLFGVGKGAPGRWNPLRVRLAMKTPNLRLPETQAVASAWIGVLAMLCIAALTVFVFKGFNMEEKVIPYNASEGYGRFRPYLVLGMTPIAFLVGLAAGILGFLSLGQKRNTKQTHS